MVSSVAPALRMALRISDRAGDRRLQKWNAVERGPEDLARVGAQVTAEDLLVNGAEIDRVLEVACGIEARQARLCSVQAAFDRVAGQQQGRGPSRASASAGVLLGSPAELRPRRDEHLVRHAVRGQVLVKRSDRGIQVA